MNAKEYGFSEGGDYACDGLVTLESVGVLINDFLSVLGVEDRVFETELRKHCLWHLNQQDGQATTFSQSDIGPIIWAFYEGYQAALNAVLGEIRGERTDIANI